MISFAHIPNILLESPPTAADRTTLALAVQDAVRAASQAGLVVTVVQVPGWPLAMGHYDTLIEVRERLVR